MNKTIFSLIALSLVCHPNAHAQTAKAAAASVEAAEKCCYMRNWKFAMAAIAIGAVAAYVISVNKGSNDYDRVTSR